MTTYDQIVSHLNMGSRPLSPSDIKRLNLSAFPGNSTIDQFANFINRNNPVNENDLPIWHYLASSCILALSPTAMVMSELDKMYSSIGNLLLSFKGQGLELSLHDQIMLPYNTIFSYAKCQFGHNIRLDLRSERNNNATIIHYDSYLTNLVPLGVCENHDLQRCTKCNRQFSMRNNKLHAITYEFVPICRNCVNPLILAEWSPSAPSAFKLRQHIQRIRG